MTPSLTRRWLPLIIGLAIGFRAGLALIHPTPINAFPDSQDYDHLARALLAGPSYAVDAANPNGPMGPGPLLATRMPGYPLLIAAVYSLTHYSFHAILILQALLGGLTVWLTASITRRLGASELTALLAAALAALDPLSLGFSNALLSETPFTFCLLLTLYLCLRLSTPIPRQRTLTLWALLGLTWLAAIYLRPSALLLLLPLLLWLAKFTPSPPQLPPAPSLASPPIPPSSPPRAPRRTLPGIALALALLALGLCPWLIRNHFIYPSGPLHLTTLEGISLYEAVYPDADGGPRQAFITLPPEMTSLNEAQLNDEWAHRAWQSIRDNPLRILNLALIKVARTWSPTFHAQEFQNKTLRAAMLLWHLPLYILGLAGLIVGRATLRRKCLIILPILYFTMVHALFLGSIRYRVPLMPLVCIFAAMGVTFLGDKCFSRKPLPSKAV